MYHGLNQIWKNSTLKIKAQMHWHLKNFLCVFSGLSCCSPYLVFGNFGFNLCLEEQDSFGKQILVYFLALLYLSICSYKFTLYIRILGWNLLISFPLITKKHFIVSKERLQFLPDSPVSVLAFQRVNLKSGFSELVVWEEKSIGFCIKWALGWHLALPFVNLTLEQFLNFDSKKWYLFFPGFVRVNTCVLRCVAQNW